MNRRDFLVGGLGLGVGAPALAQGQWNNEFIDKWVKGAWRVEYPDKSSAPTILEIYSYSPATDEKDAFDLRGGTNLFTNLPAAAKSPRAKVNGSGARVSIGNSGGSGRFEIDWRASETQEGTVQWLKSDKASPVKLRRLATAEIDAQRIKAFGGEKPTVINTSYFG